MKTTENPARYARMKYNYISRNTEKEVNTVRESDLTSTNHMTLAKSFARFKFLQDIFIDSLSIGIFEWLYVSMFLFDWLYVSIFLFDQCFY